MTKFAPAYQLNIMTKDGGETREQIPADPKPTLTVMPGGALLVDYAYHSIVIAPGEWTEAQLIAIVSSF